MIICQYGVAAELPTSSNMLRDTCETVPGGSKMAEHINNLELRFLAASTPTGRPMIIC